MGDYFPAAAAEVGMVAELAFVGKKLTETRLERVITQNLRS